MTGATEEEGAVTRMRGLHLCIVLLRLELQFNVEEEDFWISEVLWLLLKTGIGEGLLKGDTVDKERVPQASSLSLLDADHLEVEDLGVEGRDGIHHHLGEELFLAAHQLGVEAGGRALAEQLVTLLHVLERRKAEDNQEDGEVTLGFKGIWRRKEVEKNLSRGTKMASGDRARRHEGHLGIDGDCQLFDAAGCQKGCLPVGLDDVLGMDPVLNKGLCLFQELAGKKNDGGGTVANLWEDERGGGEGNSAANSCKGLGVEAARRLVAVRSFGQRERHL